MSLLVKQHASEGGLVLALCDADILGKKFSDARTELMVNTHFFGGESLPLDEVKVLLEKAYTVNAVGDKAVTLLVHQGLILSQDVKKIGRLPYAMVVRF